MLFDLLAGNPQAFIALSLLVGLLVGSFLNVVIHRLPIMMESAFREECSLLDAVDQTSVSPRPGYNLIVPRSACPACGAQIAGYDNIPVVSWLALRGRCRHCRHPISVRYPLVELSTGLITAGIAWHFGWGTQAFGAILFAWTLIALFGIDADTYLLPDSLTLPLLWAGLLFNWAGTFTSLHDAVLGAVMGYLALWLVYWSFKLATGKEGMGYGDFKLLAAIGAWLGWQSLPVVILLSSVVGAAIGIALTLLARRGWSKPLPFGPYLATAGLAAMIWGSALSRSIWG